MRPSLIRQAVEIRRTDKSLKSNRLLVKWRSVVYGRGGAQKVESESARAQCRPQAPFSRILVKWRSVVYGRGGADAKEELSNERDAKREDQGSCRGARETKEELNNKRHAFSAPVRDRENEMSGRERGARAARKKLKVKARCRPQSVVLMITR